LSYSPDIIHNPDKARQIAKNARHKVEQFDWKQVRTKWLEILS